MSMTVDNSTATSAHPRFYSRAFLNARAAAQGAEAQALATSVTSTTAASPAPTPVATPAAAQTTSAPSAMPSTSPPRLFTPRSALSGPTSAVVTQAASDTASAAPNTATTPSAAAAAYQKNAPSATSSGAPTTSPAFSASTQATQAAVPTADVLRPVTNGIYSTSINATDADLARAQAITSALPVVKDGDYGYVASEVSASDAETLIKASQRYIWNGPVAAPGGTQVGVPAHDTAPTSESTHYLSFANNGREVSSFALELSGTGFDATTLEDKLKSGVLQLDMQKWGGAGHVGEKAASLTLSGRRYSFADFGDGREGLSLNVSEGAIGDTVGGTFGGYPAKDGVTLKIRSFDPSISVTGLKLTSY